MEALWEEGPCLLWHSSTPWPPPQWASKVTSSLPSLHPLISATCLLYSPLRFVMKSSDWQWTRGNVREGFTKQMIQMPGCQCLAQSRHSIRFLWMKMGIRQYWSLHTGATVRYLLPRIPKRPCSRPLGMTTKSGRHGQVSGTDSVIIRTLLSVYHVTDTILKRLWIQKRTEKVSAPMELRSQWERQMCEQINQIISERYMCWRDHRQNNLRGSRLPFSLKWFPKQSSGEKSTE